ncbi:MAG TPA: hypothetical protein PKO06_16235 [Candidatus Ozemobacteraceae bacterium]|nr:hypothetical protein [Candidatus Ozemobacteraceae bacterium]
MSRVCRVFVQSPGWSPAATRLIGGVKIFVGESDQALARSHGAERAGEGWGSRREV